MALRHHVQPTKELLRNTHALIDQHVAEDRITQARIKGGISVLLWMVPILSVVIPAILILILYLMHRASMI